MIERIKKQVNTGNYRFTVHGFERCAERHISPNEVKCAILSSVVVEGLSKRQIRTKLSHLWCN